MTDIGLSHPCRSNSGTLHYFWLTGQKFLCGSSHSGDLQHWSKGRKIKFNSLKNSINFSTTKASEELKNWEIPCKHSFHLNYILNWRYLWGHSYIPNQHVVGNHLEMHLLQNQGDTARIGLPWCNLGSPKKLKESISTCISNPLSDEAIRLTRQTPVSGSHSEECPLQEHGTHMPK